jgi:hypothetical protein
MWKTPKNSEGANSRSPLLSYPELFLTNTLFFGMIFSQFLNEENSRIVAILLSLIYCGSRSAFPRNHGGFFMSQGIRNFVLGLLLVSTAGGCAGTTLNPQGFPLVKMDPKVCYEQVPVHPKYVDGTCKAYQCFSKVWPAYATTVAAFVPCALAAPLRPGESTTQR